MARFIVRRLVSTVIVLFAISVLTFLIFNVIPNGDPAVRLAGRNATDAQIKIIRKDWDLDKPIYAQYVSTMGKVFSGDLISYSNRLHVNREIRNRIGRTFSLAIGAALIWMAFGVALGLFTAVRAGR